ncbi:MAG: hypothetical protein IJU37_08845 [Desulfovibrio sp.]|nr:hypothetical protein [Desulfovibrio sp.]
MFPDFIGSVATALAGVLCIAVVLSLVMLRRFVHGKPDALLVVMGAVGSGRKAKILHGGITFVWPVIQSWDWLTLKPITVSLKLQGALSQENIRVNVPCTFIVAVDSENAANMETAAIRILDVIKDARQFSSFVEDIIFGQMRSVIASMKVAEINADRQGFQDRITANVSTELAKVGLKLLTVNIQDITDDAHYIENLGKRAEAEAKAEADIAIAEQAKRGESGKTANDAERRKNVSANNLVATMAENENKAKEARSNAELNRSMRETQAENDSQASIRVSDAERAAEVAKAANLKAIYAAQRDAAEAQEAMEIARARVEANAAAERKVIAARAEGEAEGQRALRKMQGEAQGSLEALQARAEGIRQVVAAADGDPRAAVMLLMNEQWPSILKEYARMAATRKIDKLVCIDGGGEGSLPALTRSLLGSVPQAAEILSAFGLLPKEAAEARMPVAEQTQRSEHDPAACGKED